jgi:membrane fusion protein, macrolide-specific efflux system
MHFIRRFATKPWVVMPLIAVLVLGGWTLFFRDDGADGAAAAQTDDQVVEVTVGNMAQTVSAEGTVAAAQTDDLSFASAGTVTAVNVQAGQAVTAGTVLATIDSAELEADVAEAEANVADAEAALADDEEAGASDAQIEADESRVTSAHDRLASAEEALTGAQLVASFDGTVAAVNVTVGEELGSGGTSGTSTTGSASGSGQTDSDLGSGQGDLGAFGDTGSSSSDATTEPHVEIVSASSFTVELGFDDTDIANLEAGRAATISLSTSSGNGGFVFPGGNGGFPGGGFPGGELPGGGLPGGDEGEDDDADSNGGPSAVSDVGSVTGQVTEVGQIADASSGVASYPVTVAFSDDSGDYNVGATVSVDITYAEVKDAIQVPRFAISTTDGASTVTVSNDGKEETRTVTTGLTSGTMVQITSGLEAGEQVVLDFPDIGGGDGGGNPGGPPNFGGATESDQ